MAVEGSLNKSLYRIEILLLKFIPMLIAGIYLLNTILSYFNIDVLIFSILGGMSILPLLFLYITSYAFKFCAYHRMFLHYILISDIINYTDYTYGIPISNRSLLVLHIIIFGLFLFMTIYLKFKVCEH